MARRRRADPLAHVQLSGPKHRQIIELLRDFEVYVQAANKTAKTTLGATLAAAWARGLTCIDGRTIREARAGRPAFPLELPPVRTPSVGIITVPSYKQSAPSTIEALRAMIGNVPHAVERVGPQATAAIIVKPDSVTSDSRDEWSRIFVFPADGELPYGIRADWAWMDEPTTLRMWTEVRNRGIAGRPYHRLITVTPIDLEKCQWLREDFDGAEWPQVRNGRVNFRLRLEDNEALSAEDIRTAREANAGSLWAKAILEGEYVNLAGSNPFEQQAEALERWLAGCRDPLRVETLNVQAEQDSETAGRIVVPINVPFEVWEDADPDEAYLTVSDSALGIRDKDHDPLGLHVYARRRRRLVARYNGYCGGYALGYLQGLVSERYNDALADTDMTGGYGGPVLSGMRAWKSRRWPHGYGNIMRDPSTERPGQIGASLGFTWDEMNKAEGMADVQQALAADQVLIPSEAVVRCLMSATVDARQRLVKPAGVHYEDLTNLMRALRLFRIRPPVPLPPQMVPDLTRVIEREFGDLKPRVENPWEDPANF